MDNYQNQFESGNFPYPNGNNNFPNFNGNNNNISYNNNFFQNKTVIPSNKHNKINLNENYNESNSDPKQSEEMKKELELENQIRDHLKCYICLTKVMKPKMCKYCKKICCESCIDKWLSAHDYCGICKHQVTSQDMIPLPFLDDMSSYFINNIDNHPKFQPNNQGNKKNPGNNILNEKNNSNDDEIINIDENNKDICLKHRSKIDFYCVQCNKYFCSNCLVFFGEEVKRHKNHLILQTSKMNDLGIKEAINEYKKLPKTKNIIENFIGLIKLKINENDIRKAEAINFINLIKDLYINKIDESSSELKNMLSKLETQRDSLEISINSIPNGFNNIVNNNDYGQGNVVSEELKKINKIDENIEDDIKEKFKINPRLFFENYETELLEIDIPFSGQYNEGLELINKELDVIPGHLSKLIMKYLQNQIYISFCINIDLPLNAPNYPKFYTYITLRNQNYKLEFTNLSQQSFPQDYGQQGLLNENSRIRQQINSVEFDAEQFLNLAGKDKKIRMKLYIIKTFYEI